MLKKALHSVPRVAIAGFVGVVVARIMRRRHEQEHQGFVHRLLAH